MTKRYEQLDSLRGIAALIVVLFHMRMLAPTLKHTELWGFIDRSPLYILFSGRESVIFFFILSGFVLSLPFHTSGVQTHYVSFLLKRICRIYIPYAFATSVAILSYYWFAANGIRGLGDLFYQLWHSPLSGNLIAANYLLIGEFDIYAVNIVVWSLTHEFRISLIFPVLLWLTTRIHWTLTIAIGITLAAIGTGFHLLFLDPLQAYYKSLFYVLMFIIGILLAKHRLYLVARFQRLGMIYQILLFTAALLIYGYSHHIRLSMLSDWSISIAASLILIISIASGKVSKFLLMKPLLFIGKISYSIYLYHLIILLSFLNALYGKMPLWAIYSISAMMIVIISGLAWYLIEKPAMKLGSALTKIRMAQTKPVTTIEPLKANKQIPADS